MSKSKPYDLAYWFVTEYLGREWTSTDAKGMHLKHAKSLLGEFSESEIKGCLLAVKNGLIQWSFQITAMTTIRSGEPPLIESFRKILQDPPPVYLEETVREWRRLNGDTQEREILSDVPVWTEELRTEPVTHAPRRRGCDESVDARSLSKLYQGI